jgi:hypothetical protein
MQRRHWRWLWIWVGVLVAGCSQILSSDGTPAATREPTLSLLGYTLLPPSLTPSVWPVYTATPLVTADSAGSHLALYLHVTGAACYETPIGSLICLGQVRNTLNLPVDQVQVEVQLLARDGTLLAAQETFVSRWVIPAGAAGPYRVLFDRVPEGYAGAYSFIKAGHVVTDAETRYAALTLKQVSGAFVLDQYQITLSIINTSPVAVERIAITMTLLNERDQITGFRRLYLDPGRRLPPGESLTLTLKVIPQGANTVAFDAFAEGYLVPN